jgi:hypothetical protein
MDQEKTALQGCELCKYSIGVEPEPESGWGYRVKGVDVAYMDHSLVSLPTQTVDICVSCSLSLSLQENRRNFLVYK